VYTVLDILKANIYYVIQSFRAIANLLFSMFSYLIRITYRIQYYWFQPFKSYPDAERDPFGHAVMRAHREGAGFGSGQVQLV
jgi:hypothetical protein